MKDRSIGLAVVAVVALVAAAIYVLLNPLSWNLGEPAPAKVAARTSSADKAPSGDKSASAVASPKAPAEASTGPSAPRLGLFDVARIDPDGPSVFAGLATPNEIVNVLVDGVIVGTAKADANGEWVVITDRKIASADPKLAIAYGQRAPVPGRLASADRASRSYRTASAEREPRTVRDVDARVMRQLGDWVEAARRDATAREVAAAPSSATRAGDTAANPATRSDAAAGSAPGADTRENGASVQTTDAVPAGVPATAAAPFAVASAASPSQERAAGSSLAASTGETLPVPIRFVYREARFTPEGKAAAVLLLEYLRLKKIGTVTLTGHADERGSYDLNMDLSADRLRAVEAFLRDGGFRGELKLVPKGKTEPFSGVDRSRFDKQALYELDRRVELKVVR